MNNTDPQDVMASDTNETEVSSHTIDTSTHTSTRHSVCMNRILTDTNSTLIHSVPEPTVPLGGTSTLRRWRAPSRPAVRSADVPRGFGNDEDDAGGSPDKWLRQMKASFGCGGEPKSAKERLATFFPMLSWLATYDWRRCLLTDVIAGLTVGIMVVPQSMSYAKLAGLPVQVGLYSSLVPIYAYAVFGSSRQLAVGPVALVSLLLSTGLTMILESEGITPDNTEDYESIYATMALQISFLVGVCYILMGLLRLGFVTIFLSHAVVSGFTSAAAIIIGLSQIKYIFGYSIPNDKSLHGLLRNLFSNISEFNWKTFVLGTSCVLFLMSTKKIASRYPRFKWTRAAGPLILTVVCIVLQATIDLEARGIPIVAYIPAGLPPFTGSMLFPVDIPRLAVVVLSIVIVGFMESIAIAKKLAQVHNYELDSSMELVGLGMANLTSGLFGGYPVTGSFSRSAVNNESGAQSGLSAVVTATMVLISLVCLTSVFAMMPLALLASIVISGVISLVDYNEAIYLWRVHKFDFSVWVVAFIGTLFLGVELGLSLAVGISLLLVIFESAYPPTAELGRLPGTHHYRNIKQYPDAEQYDGIVLVRVDAPIYFANAQHCRDKVQKYYQRAEQKLKEAYKDDNSDDKDEVQDVQFVILELTSVSHIDTSALHTLQEMCSTFRRENDIQLCLVNPNPRVMQKLVQSGLVDEIGRDHMFVSLHDSVHYCLGQMHSCEVKKRALMKDLLGPANRNKSAKGATMPHSMSLPANIGAVSEYSVAEENNDIEIGLEIGIGVDN